MFNFCTGGFCAPQTPNYRVELKSSDSKLLCECIKGVNNNNQVELIGSNGCVKLIVISECVKCVGSTAVLKFALRRLQIHKNLQYKAQIKKQGDINNYFGVDYELIL